MYFLALPDVVRLVPRATKVQRNKEEGRSLIGRGRIAQLANDLLYAERVQRLEAALLVAARLS